MNNQNIDIYICEKESGIKTARNLMIACVIGAIFITAIPLLIVALICKKYISDSKNKIKNIKKLSTRSKEENE